jgi:hypothetical protein
MPLVPQHSLHTTEGDKVASDNDDDDDDAEKTSKCMTQRKQPPGIDLCLGLDVSSTVQFHGERDVTASQINATTPVFMPVLVLRSD